MRKDIFLLIIVLSSVFSVKNLYAAGNTEKAREVFNEGKSLLYSNPKEASALAKRAIKLCDTSFPDSLCREATILYATAEQLLGNFDLSLQVINDAEMMSDTTDIHTKARLFELRGRVLSKLGDFSRSTEYNDKATSLFRSLGDSASVASCYNERGVMLLNIHNYVLAEHFFNRALEINRKLRNLQAIATNLNNMCLYPGDSDAKLKMIDEAIAINKNLDSKWALGENFNNKGKQQIFSGRYREALTSLEEASGYINEIGARELLCDYYEYMSMAKAGLGDYKDAYEYMVKMAGLVSELQRRNNQRNTEMNLARKQHEDMENAARKKEQDYQIKLLRSYIIGLIAFVVLGAVTAFLYFKWARHRKNLQLYETRHELDVKQKEVDALKMREQQLELENTQNMLSISRQELTGFAAFLKSRKEMTEKIKEMLKEGYKMPKEDITSHLKKINAFISSYTGHDTSTQTIILKAEERNKSFMEKLLTLHPNLTKGEQNLALLIRGGMSSKEISILLGLESKTINMNRYRLRKALGISPETDLENYLASL